jgi:hypothetical protein
VLAHGPVPKGWRVLAHGPMPKGSATPRIALMSGDREAERALRGGYIGPPTVYKVWHPTSGASAMAVTSRMPSSAAAMCVCSCLYVHVYAYVCSCVFVRGRCQPSAPSCCLLARFRAFCVSCGALPTRLSLLGCSSGLPSPAPRGSALMPTPGLEAAAGEAVWVCFHLSSSRQIHWRGRRAPTAVAPNSSASPSAPES